MPSEAYPSVYRQYFAVHFSVHGREQMRVLKDSTFCPREELPIFCIKSQPDQSLSRDQGKGKAPTSASSSARKDALRVTLQRLLHMERQIKTREGWGQTYATELSTWDAEGDICYVLNADYEWGAHS